jgi:hypothetical protein
MTPGEPPRPYRMMPSGYAESTEAGQGPSRRERIAAERTRQAGLTRRGVLTAVVFQVTGAWAVSSLFLMLGIDLAHDSWWSQVPHVSFLTAAALMICIAGVSLLPLALRAASGHLFAGR